jgi:hypothetical protein
MELLRCLIYDFLRADDAICDSTKYDDIREWVTDVVEKLNPSIKAYSKKQIDFTMALVLSEKSVRDANYKDLYCRYTEIYRNGGGVF